MRRSAILALPMLVVIGAGSLPAQERPGLTLDATIGLGRVFRVTGQYGNLATAAGELTVARRVRTGPAWTGALALSAGGQMRLSTMDICLVGPGGGCLPAAPSVYHVGVLGGGESLRRWLPVRVLAGPAFYFGEGPSGAGAQLQLDAATPAVGRVALVLSARGSYIARFNGERLQLGALGAGFRVQ